MSLKQFDDVPLDEEDSGLADKFDFLLSDSRLANKLGAHRRANSKKLLVLLITGDVALLPFDSFFATNPNICGSWGRVKALDPIKLNKIFIVHKCVAYCAGLNCVD